MGKSSHTATVGSAAIEGAVGRIGKETTVSRLLRATCGELVELLDASRGTISRVIGDLIVHVSAYDRSHGDRALELYLLADYPLTQEVLETGEPRTVIRTDPAADTAEAALLERLELDALLMVRLRARGKNWGLVEIYTDEGGFSQEQVDVAVAVIDRVGDLLAELESAA